MRLLHRQRTGLFSHLPVFFVIVGLLAGFMAAPGHADVASSHASGVSATDGSEDPDALIQLYLEWMVRQMRAPQPASLTAEAYARAVARAYQETGTPDLKPTEVRRFIETIASTQALLSEHPWLLDAETTSLLNAAFVGLLVDLGGEGRVMP